MWALLITLTVGWKLVCGLLKRTRRGREVDEVSVPVVTSLRVRQIDKHVGVYWQVSWVGLGAMACIELAALATTQLWGGHYSGNTVVREAVPPL